MDISQKQDSTSTNPDNLSNAIHQSCQTLPLSNFIKCLCDGEINALIIAGEVTLAELQSAWMNIFYEYIDLCKNSDMKAVLRLNRRLLVLRNKILEINLMVRFIAVQWNEEYVDTLRSFGYRYKFNPLNKKQFTKDLDLTLSRCKRLETEKEIIELELKAYEDASLGEKPNREYIMSDVRKLTKWLNIRLDPAVITVEEFCGYKNDYHAEIRINNEKNKK